MADARRTYVLVDGENIDATLGNAVLGRKPEPNERPRWERLIRFFEDRWGQAVSGLFFLSVTNGEMPVPFVNALRGLGFRPIPLSGPAGVKVVDVAVQRTLDALLRREADVVLASHDGDFLPQIEHLCSGRRRVALAGFPELVNGGYMALRERGLELVDMESDVGAFNVRLPRLRVIPLDEFDPEDFL